MIPNPGSPEAQARGCICPVIDNCHGAGVHRGTRILPDGSSEPLMVWWQTAGCPLHDPREIGR